MDAVSNGSFHQFVISRMKFHCVDALTEAAVGVQNWFVGVSLDGQFDGAGATGKLAESSKLVGGPGCAVAVHQVGENAVAAVHVVVNQWARLIG